MYRKLRPPILGTEGILGILSISTFFLLMVFSYKVGMGFGAIICLFAAILSLIVILRTKNLHFIPLFIGQIFAVVVMSLAAFTDVKDKLFLVLPFVVVMGASFMIAIIFTIQRKLKWRTRETLELAAQPLKDKTNGLTHRPLQAGKIDYSPEELNGFASFIQKNLIAIPVHEAGRMVFILNIPFNRFLTFSKTYHDRTWVSFDQQGNVTVNISQDDYFMYREQWAFDQLCISLGNLFIDFMEHYKNGSEARIIQSMNALNLNIITEG